MCVQTLSTTSDRHLEKKRMYVYIVDVDYSNEAGEAIEISRVEWLCNGGVG